MDGTIYFTIVCRPLLELPYWSLSLKRTELAGKTQGKIAITNSMKKKINRNISYFISVLSFASIHAISKSSRTSGHARSITFTVDIALEIITITMSFAHLQVKGQINPETVKSNWNT